MQKIQLETWNFTSEVLWFVIIIPSYIKDHYVMLKKVTDFLEFILKKWFFQFFKAIQKSSEFRDGKLWAYDDKWVKVFKNRPSKICGRQPLKTLMWYGLLSQTISLQIFKNCLPQIFYGPFMNNLTQMY